MKNGWLLGVGYLLGLISGFFAVSGPAHLFWVVALFYLGLVFLIAPSKPPAGVRDEGGPNP